MDFFNQLPETINDLQSNVDFYGIVFIMFSALILGAGLLTVLSKKFMHSAVGLLFTLFGIAGLYALLAADFIAITQVMVYIGGILTLIIFGVMLTSRVSDKDRKTQTLGSVSVATGAILAIATGAFLSYIFVSSDWKQVATEVPEGTIQAIGNLLMTDYLAAFIVTAVLLLVAFIGAALIARRRN